MILYVITGFLCFGCSLSDSSSNSDLKLLATVSDFSQSQDGWEADFSDYPATDSVKFNLQFSYTNLPSNLGSGKSIMLSGTNYSNDLFMFIKKKVDGLLPNTEYTLTFEVEFASNAASGGTTSNEGSPGESVFLKAGAVAVEPSKVVNESDYILNIDKGQLLYGGQNMIVLGNIAAGINPSNYTLLTRTNANDLVPFVATTNSAGELWLIVGTDSGFIGTTTIYYTKVSVALSTR